jgi:iron complex outermembrane receptor protein
MKPSRWNLTVGTLLLGMSAIVARYALADTAVTAPNQPLVSDELESITVVAQKQNVDLQRAPVALTALSGADLKESNVVMPLDLNGQVPGLVITTSEGFNRSVSIRGIGFNVPQDDSAQPSVSYHEDGIYIVYPVALNSGFLDVDHVEVLRGPQGTVFGQNSIGGTINVISKLPTFDAVNGYVDAETGSYDLVHTSAAVNIPLASNFAVRVAFDQIYQKGDVVASEVSGANGSYDLNNQNNFHGRIQALWDPMDDLSVLLRAEYDQAHQHEVQGKNIDDPDPNPWRDTSDWPGRLIYNQQLAAATITYDFGPASLKFLSSYQEVNQHGSVNEDGMSIEVTGPLDEPHDVEYFMHNSKAISEEINLASKPGGVLDWIVGGFYLKSRLTVGYDQYNLFPGDPDYPGTDTAAPNLLNLTLPGYNALPAAQNAWITNAIYDGQLYFQNVGIENRDSVSAYGQTIWHITDALRFTTGLRYTHDHNTTFFDDYYNLFYPNQALFLEQTVDRTTYRVGLDYDVTLSNLLYGSVSTGLKPGGGNISDSPAVVPFQFQPETITAFELGSKNSFFDKKLTANLSAFLYRDKNMQFQAEDLVNYQGGVDNIPQVIVTGLEGEVAALLPHGFRVDGNFTWEHGKITSHFMALDNVSGNAANLEYQALYPDATYFAVCTPVGTCPALDALRKAAYRDVYGNAPPSLPTFMGSVSLSHTLAFADGSGLLSRFALQYRSDYADTIFGKTPIYTAPSYVLMNLYFDYKFGTIPGLDVSFAINNVADRAAVLSRFTNQFGGETTQQYFPPREFVAGARYQF